MKTSPVISRRRLRFAMIVIVSQLLLIALAIAWGVHLILIVQNGGVLSIETNPWILYGEIFATVLIIMFALVVVVLEFKRMITKRKSDTENGGEREHSEVDGESKDLNRAEYIEDLLR